jgi:hypothetical protein
MQTWKLSLKPSCNPGYDPFDYCKENNFISLGWAHYYSDRPSATTIEEAKEAAYTYNKVASWPSALRTLMEKVEIGDHVWIHQRGKYFLCKVIEGFAIGAAIHEEFEENDLGHARRAIWVEVPQELISGTVQRGTIAKRMIQRIYLSEKEAEYNELLFKNLSANSTWRPEINDTQFPAILSKPDSRDTTFSLMTPDDVEDMVAMYLQDKGWKIIKSTCFRSKPEYEFSMLHSSGQYGAVQVKSGKYPAQLAPSSFQDEAAKGTQVFLFSTHPSAYPGPSVNNVSTISKEDLFSWMQSNSWAIPTPLKVRLWTCLQ